MALCGSNDFGSNTINTVRTSTTKVRIDVYAWIPHAMIVNPDFFVAGSHFWGDGSVTPPMDSFRVPGTFRAHQVLEFAVSDSEKGTHQVLTSKPEIGISHALSNGTSIRSAKATTNSQAIRLEHVSSTRNFNVVMKMEIGIPFATTKYVTPDIEWDLDLHIRGRAGAFVFRSKGFPSYWVYAAVDGSTKRLTWHDLSPVDPESGIAIGRRLSSYRPYWVERGFVIE